MVLNDSDEQGKDYAKSEDEEQSDEYYALEQFEKYYASASEAFELGKHSNEASQINSNRASLRERCDATIIYRKSVQFENA